MDAIYTFLFESKDMKHIKKIGLLLLIITLVVYLLLIVELWKC